MDAFNAQSTSVNQPGRQHFAGLTPQGNSANGTLLQAESSLAKASTHPRSVSVNNLRAGITRKDTRANQPAEAAHVLTPGPGCAAVWSGHDSFMIKLLIFSGSARADSVNQKLARTATTLAQETGANVEFLDVADYPLPLFDEDTESAEGLPDNAKIIKTKVTEADALIISSPEYNSSVTPLLKNLIDWISRTETDDEPALSAYQGKIVGLLSASPGQLGGMRGLVHLRSILGNIGVLVVPAQFSLVSAYGKFDEAGLLIDESARKSVAKVIKSVVETASKLKA